MTASRGAVGLHVATPALVAGVLLGLLLVVIGYVGAEEADDLSSTIGALNLAVGGVIVAGAAEIGWLVTARRKVSLLRDRVLDAYALPDEVVAVPAATTATDIVSVAGSTWYHDPGCPLLKGKQRIPLDAGHGLDPCAICCA